MRLIDADKLNRKDVNCANVPMNFIDTAPTVDAIPKDQYEQRLKADLKAILTELQLEIEELDSRAGYDGNGMPTFSTDYIRKKKVNELIQQKSMKYSIEEKLDKLLREDGNETKH